ncbi:MAG: hypothetical protein WKF93_08180 [Acidimicrobiales bacterium]
MRTRSLAVAGISAGLLVGGAAGLTLTLPGTAGAQDVGDEATTETTADEAGADDTAEREAAAEARLREALAPLVDDGTISAEQADAVAATLAAELPGRGHHRPGAGIALDAVAEVLGTDEDALREELRGGATVGELADAADVERQAVIDAIVAAATERAAEAVADGRLTQAEADEHLARLAERLPELLDAELPGGGRGPDGGGHGGRGPDAEPGD